jgi:hypothetical protein
VELLMGRVLKNPNSSKRKFLTPRSKIVAARARLLTIKARATIVGHLILPFDYLHQVQSTIRAIANETKGVWEAALHSTIKSENKLNQLRKAVIYGEKPTLVHNGDIIHPSRVLRIEFKFPADFSEPILFDSTAGTIFFWLKFQAFGLKFEVVPFANVKVQKREKLILFQTGERAAKFLQQLKQQPPAYFAARKLVLRRPKVSSFSKSQKHFSSSFLFSKNFCFGKQR